MSRAYKQDLFSKLYNRKGKLALLIFVIGFASKKIMSKLFKKEVLPQSVKIGGFVYTINEVDGLADNGSTDFDHQIILIRKNMTDDRKLSALVHEELECINELYDLNLSHQNIQTLEAAIFQLAQDN